MIRLALTTGFALLIPFTALATPAQHLPGSAGGDAVEAMARASDQEQKRQSVTKKLAAIRTQAELEAYLSNASRRPSPLDKLTPRGRKSFVESLKFNGQGLTQFDHSILTDELCATDAYRILALFGVEHTTPLLKGLAVTSRKDALIMALEPQQSLYAKDHMRYWCASPGTCEQSATMICLDGC